MKKASIQKTTLLPSLVLSGLSFFGMIPVANALPQGGNVTSGEIKFRRSPGQLQINQFSNKGIIHWNRFDIGASERVFFQQSSASSATLNRVTGSFSSEISGRLDAVGKVLLINPNGIVFTRTAQVDVGSILATTLDLKDTDFLADFYQLQQQSNHPLKTVENYGSIRVKDRGFAAFVAPGVENHGVIQARLGKVAIGSGTSATLDFFGDELLSVAVDSSLGDRIYNAQGQPISRLINQAGTIEADGGQVVLSAATGADLFSQVINLDGVVRARSLRAEQGQIVLSGGEIGQVAINGIIDTSAADPDVDAGQINVSGADIQVGESAQLLANADQAGNGGEISVIGAKTAQIDGALSSRGGDLGGDGGQIETSAKEGLGVSESAQIDAGSPQGEAGTWRLDPDRLFIDATSANNNLPGPATGDFSVSASVIETALDVGNVDLEANELIQVDAPIDTSIQTNANTLTFKDQNADNNLTINLNAAVNLGPDQMLTGEGSVVNVNSTATDSAQAGVDVAASGGVVNLGAGSFTGTGAQDSVVTINKDLTLQGTGPGTIIDGQSEGRGVNVEAGTVTIQNLTVANGSVQGSFNQLSTGGGISIESGANVTVNQSLIQNSEASIGGGIFNAGTLNLLDSTVTGNMAFEVNSSSNIYDISGGVGGGVLNSANATLQISNTTISNNNAEYGGGGIGNLGNATVQSSVISGNVAQDQNTLPDDYDLTFGGGVGNVGTLDIVDSMLQGNSASTGGGLFNGTQLDVDPNVVNPTFAGNVEISNSQITQNNAFNVALPQGSYYQNYISDLRYIGGGGGIFNGLNATLQITQSSISSNSSEGSGAGVNNADGLLTIQNSTLSENVSNGEGGGIISSGERGVGLTSGSLLLEGSTVSGNTAESEGGGIYVENGTASIINSTISGNTSASGLIGMYLEAGGGGLHIDDDSVVSIINSTITGNISNTYGGGIYIEDDDTQVTIRNSIISGNNAIQGAEVYIEDISYDPSNALVSQGFNIVGQNGDAGGFSTIGTDIVLASGTNSVIDPVLRNNGGPTQTHALVSGSPAINAGSNALAVDQNGNSLTTDQRGLSRFQGTSVDIGAFEVQETTPPPPPPLPPPPEDEDPDLGEEQRLDKDSPTSDRSKFLPGNGSQKSQPYSNPFVKESPIASTNADIDELETAFTRTVDRYFGTSTPEVLSPQLVEQTLRTIDTIPDVTPALLYAYFAEPEIEVGRVSTPSLVASTDLTHLSQNPPSSETTNTVSTDSKCLSEQPSTASDPLWQFDDCGWEELYPNLKQQRDDDQLVIVLVTSDGQRIRKRIPDATRAKLGQSVKRFQRSISGSLSSPLRKQQLGQELYQIFIDPIRADLESRNVNNLVFIMDEGLRAIPMAALHDGDDYIINQYSMGFMPSMTLADTSYESIKGAKLLAMGAQTFEELSALPSVPLEISTIQNLWGGESFLDEAFTAKQLTQSRQGNPYSIVHLATHGEFIPGKRDRSYIQFWDKKLGLDQLEQLKLNQDPQVSLLVLSACRTALGDPSAELGFTGLAVTSGVKTAMGGLWYISDLGTYALMVSFYENLKTAPIKAEALRRAQLSLLQGTVYIKDGNLITPQQTIPLPASLASVTTIDLTDPSYWSGITMIGSPW